MKIMWITSIHLPIVTENIEKKPNLSGGWVHSMVEELEKNDEISEIRIIGVLRTKKALEFKKGKVTYTLLPSKNGVFKFDPKLTHFFHEQINRFRPDIIDIQGIEFYLAKSLLRVETNIPIIATIQGLTSECYKHYYAGISFSNLVFTRTLRNAIFFDGIISGRNNYKIRGINEVDSLKKIKYALGRTEWDKTCIQTNNSEIEYYKCNRNLRSEFYTTSWSLTSMERYSLFMTQSRYPLKGLHLLLEAVFYLVKSYPELTLYVGGKNMIERETLFQKLSFSGYQKYIQKLIKKLQLTDNVVFTGPLSAQEVAKRLTKTHVFVLPSVIENSPNALGEAQLVGTPSIAALVGGNGDYIEENKTGLLYNCYEPKILASKIEKIFSDDSLALNLSDNAKTIAINRHNRKKNASDLVKAYNFVINKHKNQSKY